LKPEGLHAGDDDLLSSFEPPHRSPQLLTANIATKRYICGRHRASDIAARADLATANG
jgi:hypothetical protein